MNVKQLALRLLFFNSFVHESYFEFPITLEGTDNSEVHTLSIF